MDTTTSSSNSTEGVASIPELPPLSAAERKVFNAMAEHMDHFHDHFRRVWREIERLCGLEEPSDQARAKIAIIGLRLCSNLNSHHTIEEKFLFPVLAERMPNFVEHASLITQHEVIHAGLDKLHDYLRECNYGERALDVVEVKQLMSSFGSVLWAHLDDEVRELGADNMRKYWTIQEMQEMPM